MTIISKKGRKTFRFWKQQQQEVLRRSPVLVNLYTASKIFEKMTRKPNNWLEGQKFPEDGRTDKNVKAQLRMHLQSF